MNAMQSRKVLDDSSPIQEVIQHPAWHGLVNEGGAEILLQDKKAHTYLLRPGYDPHHFFLSYISKNSPIIHQSFEYLSTLGLFRNGDPRHLKSLDDLIPEMMHCSKWECIPLFNPL